MTNYALFLTNLHLNTKRKLRFPSGDFYLYTRPMFSKKKVQLKNVVSKYHYILIWAIKLKKIIFQFVKFMVVLCRVNKRLVQHATYIVLLFIYYF